MPCIHVCVRFSSLIPSLIGGTCSGAATKSLFSYPHSLHCARITGALAAAVWNAAFVFDVPVRELHKLVSDLWRKVLKNGVEEREPEVGEAPDKNEKKNI